MVFSGEIRSLWSHKLDIYLVFFYKITLCTYLIVMCVAAAGVLILTVLLIVSDASFIMVIAYFMVALVWGISVAVATSLGDGSSLHAFW